MPTSSYKDYLQEELRDIDIAAGFLTECFALGMDEFLLGLKNVVEANGGIGHLANVTELNRENLYKLLSDKGNPRLSSLGLILNAIGIKIQFAVLTGEQEEEAA